MKKVLVIAFIVLLIDQITKIYVKTHFFLHEEVNVLGWFNITYVENPGMAYGVQWGGFLGKIGLSVLRLGLIAIIAYYINKWSKQSKTWYFILPAGLIFAGAIGNLIDSIFYGIIFDSGTTYNHALKIWDGYSGISQLNFHGYAPVFGGCVVDMFHFSFFPYIFNVADSAITIGAIILGYVYLFKQKHFPKELLGKK